MPLANWSTIANARVFNATLIGERSPIEELRAELAPHLTGCFDIVGPDGYRPDQTWFEITSADHSCAVANAVPELMAMASEVIGTNDADGVAEWLEHHLRS